MAEVWKTIRRFEDYSVSNFGRIMSERSGYCLALSQNQSGLVNVGLFLDGIQYHRSVPLLVAKAFIENKNPEVFDTPINMDGNRWNNRVDNLVWRPRWFAIKYHQQFRFPYIYPIHRPIEDIRTGEVSANSFECSMRYGLLESDIVMSIENRTFVWPTYQQFRVIWD